MLSLPRLLWLLLIIISYGYCEDAVYDEMEMVPSSPLAPQDIDTHPEADNLIEKFKNVATLANKLDNEGVTSLEDMDKLYNDMSETIEDLIPVIKYSKHAYTILKDKNLGLVTDNLKIDYESLKVNTLILLKVLFDVAPTTTNTALPITTVDSLLDIFENDNLALKAHSLNILYLWLPGNPRIQARVMKLKGLQPFYAQISKLDTKGIKMLLDLFNKILSEHLKARSDVQRTIIDADKLKFYQRIGLLEHMATPTVCNGLLKIFVWSWSYDSKDNDVLVTVFELIKNVKQFCLNLFRGKPKALKLFSALKEYVQGPQNKDNFVLNGVNVTDLTLVIEDYVDNLKNSVKDEF